MSHSLSVETTRLTSIIGEGGSLRLSESTQESARCDWQSSRQSETLPYFENASRPVCLSMPFRCPLFPLTGWARRLAGPGATTHEVVTVKNHATANQKRARARLLRLSLPHSMPPPPYLGLAEATHPLGQYQVEGKATGRTASSHFSCPFSTTTSSRTSSLVQLNRLRSFIAVCCQRCGRAAALEPAFVI